MRDKVKVVKEVKPFFNIGKYEGAKGGDALFFEG